MSNGLTRILKPATAATGLTLLLASAAMLMQSSETMLRQSFERALTAPGAGVQLAAPGGAPIAASEEFWLTAMGREPSASHGVSLGDRITLTLDGKERSYRVTSVSDISPAATHIDTRPRTDRLLLVTAKDTADALSRPIRFVIDIDGASGVIAGSPARAS